MAVILMKEIDGTGFQGDYWRLNSIYIERGKTSNEDILVGTFNLYKSSTDYSNDKKQVGISVQTRVTGNITLATTVGQMFNALYTKVVDTDEKLDGGVSDE